MERTKTLLATVLIGSFGAFLAGPAEAAPSPSPHDDKLAAAVKQWFAGGGQDRITALRTDFEAIAKSAGRSDVPAMKDGCAILAADVGKAQHYAPLPDFEAEWHWSAALEMYAKGAADCVKGATNLDGSRLKSANEEIRMGGMELTKATARVEEILR